jgi:hypothetical protein
VRKRTRNFAHAESIATLEKVLDAGGGVESAPLAKQYKHAKMQENQPQKRTKTENKRFSAEDDANLVNALESNPNSSWSDIAILLNINEKSLQNR